MNDDVLYLEADEEITAAIDKLLGAKAASVRVVVPKRSTLLQSIVNLKLLKKAAADANKQLVLVTADRTATHLAGQVGLAVAASLNARPAVPTRPQPAQDSAGDIIEAAEETDQTAPGVTPPPAASAKTTKPGFARP
ncbi:MAG TPA: hypothetical protein VK963_01545, partial [Candidatus Saccharimonadales bacterium]|nr:hypothetical protein [Candidatus Saccharimonadales bacterium]